MSADGSSGGHLDSQSEEDVEHVQSKRVLCYRHRLLHCFYDFRQKPGPG